MANPGIHLPENPIFPPEPVASLRIGEIVASSALMYPEDAISYGMARIVTDAYFGSSESPTCFRGAKFRGTGEEMEIQATDLIGKFEEYQSAGTIVSEGMFLYLLVEHAVRTRDMKITDPMISRFREQLIAEKIARRVAVSAEELAIDRARRFRCLRLALASDPENAHLFYTPEE